MIRLIARLITCPGATADVTLTHDLGLRTASRYRYISPSFIMPPSHGIGKEAGA